MSHYQIGFGHCGTVGLASAIECYNEIIMKWFDDFLKKCVWLIDYLSAVPPPMTPQPTPTPPEPVTPPVEAPVPSQAPSYDWSTPEAVRHSVRVICDEEGLSVVLKNTMCATIQAESGGNFNTKAIHRNEVGGKLYSTDWGLCQWNDVYHGKEMPPDVALNDPEAAVRLMAKYWKMGEVYRRWWVAYSTGLYKHYL